MSRLRASFGCSLGPRQQSWVRVVLPDQAGGQGSARTPAPASAQHQRGLDRLLRQRGCSAWGQPRSPAGWGQGVKARALCVLLIPRYLPDKPKLRHGSAESLTGSYATAKAAAPCCQRGALLRGCEHSLGVGQSGFMGCRGSGTAWHSRAAAGGLCGARWAARGRCRGRLSLSQSPFLCQFLPKKNMVCFPWRAVVPPQDHGGDSAR